MKTSVKLLIPIAIILVAAGVAGAAIESQRIQLPSVFEGTGPTVIFTTTYPNGGKNYLTQTAIMTTTASTTTATATAPYLTEQTFGTTSSGLSDRLVVYTASVDLNVSSVQQTIPLIDQIAVSEGGYMSQSILQPIPKGLYVNGREVAEQGFSATLTLKIPADHYGDTQSRIMNLGKVVSYSLSTKLWQILFPASLWMTAPWLLSSSHPSPSPLYSAPDR